LAGTAAAEVELLGVDGPIAANVLAHLDLDEEPCDAPRLRVEQLHGRSPARIRDALQAFGYYEPTIEPVLLHTSATVFVTLAVTGANPTASSAG